MTAKQAIRHWVVKHCREQGIARGLLALAAAVAAFVTLAMTQFAIFMVLLFWTHIVPLSQRGVVWGSWIGLAFLFGLYFLTDQRHLEKLEFESQGRLVTARMAARITGNSFFNLAAGPKTLSSFIKVICSLLLIGPTLAVACWRLIGEVWGLLRLDPDLVAQGLQQLAKAGRRIPPAAVAKGIPPEDAERLLLQLSLIDGVVVRGGETAGLYLTESLMDDLRKACEQRSAGGDE